MWVVLKYDALNILSEGKSTYIFVVYYPDKIIAHLTGNHVQVSSVLRQTLKKSDDIDS